MKPSNGTESVEAMRVECLLGIDIGDLDKTGTPEQIERIMRDVAGAFATRRLLRDALLAALKADPVDAEKDLMLALKLACLRAAAIERRMLQGTANKS